MRSYYQTDTVIKYINNCCEVISSLVLWRSAVAVASLPRGQFAWRPVYGGQLSCGQLSCTMPATLPLIQHLLFLSVCIKHLTKPNSLNYILRPRSAGSNSNSMYSVPVLE